MIRNLGATLDLLKPKLKSYLLKKGTQFKGRLFTCPNRAVHRHQDMKPGCNFLDQEETQWYCYVCFPRDTLITTDTGYRNIQEILIGDTVVSHDGSHQRVLAVYENPSSNLIKLCIGTPEFLECTPEHPIYTISEDQLHRTKYIDLTPCFKEAQRLTKKDLVLTPVVHQVDRLKSIVIGDTQVPLSSRVLKVLGLFLAEGCVSGDHTVVNWTLNLKKEKALALEIQQTLREEFRLESGLYISSSQNTVTVSVYKIVATQALQFFSQFYNEARDKIIPSFLYTQLSDTQSLELLMGWMLGDGIRDKSSRFSYIGATTSRSLAYQMYSIAVRNYYYPSGRCETNYYTLRGQKLQGKDLYEIRLRNRDSLLTSKNRSWERLFTRSLYIKFKDQEYYARPIARIIKRHLNHPIPVYNLAVDHTNTYVAGNIAVHNCGEKGDILNAANLIEGRPITGYGFHETVEYLCKLLQVPYELSRGTSDVESTFIMEMEKFLETLVEKSHATLLKLITEQPEHPTVKFLKTKGWDKSVEEYKLGAVLQVQEAKSQQVKDMLNFLNLNLNDLVNNVIIPITFHQRCIGFQIRITDETNPQKYKTFLTTQKGLFNLDKVDPTKPVYVVEGASSAIVLHQAGIDNVVATLGNSLNEDHYESLVGREVKQIIIWYDNDDGGDIGRQRIAKMCVKRSDIDIQFMLLTSENDPADYILAKKEVKDLPLLSLWDYLLRIGQRDLQLIYVANQSDLIKKEQLVGELAKALNVTKTILLEELQKHETGSISTIQTLKEKESLVEHINTFEKWAWSRGNLLGLSSFKAFDESFDGLQEGLILVGGNPNVGKSALMISLTNKILDKNPDTYIVYFSIDDSVLITMARFLANLSGIPINIVSNPKYRIVESPYYTDAEKKDLIVRREKALDYLKNNVRLFNLKDSASGYTVEYINTLLKSVEPLTKDRKLVVFVDNLHKLRSEKYYKSDKVLVEYVCSNLKILSGMYRCPVICFEGQTPILMKDFSTKSIQEIQVGEEVQGIVPHLRHWQTTPAKVEKVFKSLAQTYRVVFEDGRELIVTENHPILQWDKLIYLDHEVTTSGWVKSIDLKQTKLLYQTVGNRDSQWTRGYITAFLNGDGHINTKTRDCIFYQKDRSILEQIQRYLNLIDPSIKTNIYNYTKSTNVFNLHVSHYDFEKLQALTEHFNYSSISWCRGYLAGVYDAEGLKVPGERIDICTTNSKILSRIKQCCQTLQYRLSVHKEKKYYSKHQHKWITPLVCHIKHHNSPEVLNFLTECQPHITQRRQLWHYGPEFSPFLKVKSIEKGLVLPVYNLQTSSDTYLANGVIVHNCTVEHTKQAIQEGYSGGSAMKETSSLHYDANLILTVAVKETIGNTKLLDLVVSKNKFSTFIGILPFTLYPELSKCEESGVSDSVFK